MLQCSWCACGVAKGGVGWPSRAVPGTGMGTGTVPLLLLVEANLLSPPLAGCTGKAELGLLRGTVATSL